MLRLSEVKAKDTSCSLLNLRDCSPQFDIANERRHEELSGPEMLGSLRGLRLGVDGVGGIALSFRQGTYVRGSAKLSSKLVNVGELYRREMVPTDERFVLLKSTGFVEIVERDSELSVGEVCSLPRVSLLHLHNQI